MRVRPERSKRELKDSIDRRKHGLDKREKHMKRVVKENKEIADVSHKLRYPTKEGAAEIKKRLVQAAEATKKEFRKQNEDLEKKHKTCKDAEGDLKDRTKMAKDNAAEAKKAERQIQETRNAKPLLGQAEKTSIDDAKFTDKERGRQERDLKRSKGHRDDLKRALQGTKLKL